MIRNGTETKDRLLVMPTLGQWGINLIISDVESFNYRKLLDMQLRTGKASDNTVDISGNLCYHLICRSLSYVYDVYVYSLYPLLTSVCIELAPCLHVSSHSPKTCRLRWINNSKLPIGVNAQRYLPALSQTFHCCSPSVRRDRLQLPTTLQSISGYR